MPPPLLPEAPANAGLGVLESPHAAGRDFNLAVQFRPSLSSEDTELRANQGGAARMS
jgi:hypothetical protein